MATSKPTILLAPTDPTSPLLADGVCGGRVPTMGQINGRWCTYGDADRCFVSHRALVLALDGVPVAEGCDRANRVGRWVGGCVAEWEMSDALLLAKWCERHLNCRVIVLDGGEVRDA